jgi:ATP-dependent DNA helicase RecG
MSDHQQFTLPLTPPGDRPVQLLSPHEVFARAEATLLSRLIENSAVEKKNGKIRQTVLSEYFSMWANTGPDGGIILVGIENDGTKTGLVGSSDRQIAEIELAGPNLCPDARFEQKRIPIINNKGFEDFVIIFYIKYSENRVVENHRRKAYIRRGSDKHEILDFEKHQLRMDRGEIDFENEPCSLAYPEKFDTKEIDGFCEAVRFTLNGASYRTNEEVLQVRGLGKIVGSRFVPNNACALLFAIDPNDIFPGCMVRFFRFDGDVEGTGARFNATKDVWIKGTIPKIIESARAWIKSQVREYTRLGPDGKFFQGPEYPDDAWYEAIVNACVHRSYNMRNQNVFVKMFDSKLEIESPGGFPPGITPENIYNHSIPRNRRLCEAMFFLKYVLCAHEGTRRMRETMQEFGLPSPKFMQSDVDGITVRVTLENNIAFRKQYVDSRAIEVIGFHQFKTLSEKERTVVNYTAEHDKITVSDASRVVKGGWKQIKALLEGLCTRNIMKRISPMEIERDPKAHYILASAPKERSHGDQHTGDAI